MSYTARMKVKFSNKAFEKITEYIYVNYTQQNGKFGKFDENGYSEIYACNKNDKVSFSVTVDKINVTPVEGVYVPVVENGNWEDAVEYIVPATIKKNEPNVNEIKLVKARTNINNNIYIIMGYGKEPAKGKEVVDNQEDFDIYGLGRLINLRSVETQVFVFYSTTTDATIDRIAKNIKYYNKINSKIKTIIVGHSQGADNAIYITKKYKDLVYDLIITLDIADATGLSVFGKEIPLGGVDDSMVGPNAKIVINYYQNSEFFTGDKVRKVASNKTKILNVLSPGSNHRSIDNDLSKYIYSDLKEYLNGKDIMAIAKSRKLPKFDPKSSASEDMISQKD